MDDELIDIIKETRTKGNPKLSRKVTEWGRAKKAAWAKKLAARIRLTKRGKYKAEIAEVRKILADLEVLRQLPPSEALQYRSVDGFLCVDLAWGLLGNPKPKNTPSEFFSPAPKPLDPPKPARKSGRSVLDDL